MRSTSLEDAVAATKSALEAAGIVHTKIETRPFPNETIVVIYVSSEYLQRANEIANQIDHTLGESGFRGFTTVKVADESPNPATFVAVPNLADSRVGQLIDLLVARSRTSDIQPSLEYISDAGSKLSVALTPRHHLIFGRRGSGKTSLLVEAKRQHLEKGGLAVWINMQSVRQVPYLKTFLIYCQRICDQLQAFLSLQTRGSNVLSRVNALSEEIGRLLTADDIENSVHLLIPQLQSLIHRILIMFSFRLFIFLDDFHYIDRSNQPKLLDLMHATIRDCDAWLKVASIRHLSKWFEPASQVGLELSHDAALIDLDITLQNPAAAKKFLEQMLQSYSARCHTGGLSYVFSKDSLDRLVLASGAVPRDYLVLCAKSIQQAQKRDNAKSVGVQDVNRAAGETKQSKIDELEDDAASAQGESTAILESLKMVRKLCIDERSWTCFRVDFRDKEGNPSDYARLAGLMDVRLMHLVEPSLSDEHVAGHRSEVFMLDLSQFVGHRLKRKLRLLDFSKGYFVLKDTVTNRPEKVADTPNNRLSVFRRIPLIRLEQLKGAGG